MNSIPLIKGNTPQEINTSIIALKKALSELEAQDRLLQGTDKDVQDKIKQINELIEGINTHLGTVDSHLTAIDGQITALQPVDTVTSGNMHSVTSNAVYNALIRKIGMIISQPETVRTFDLNTVGLADGSYLLFVKDWYSSWNAFELGVLNCFRGEFIYWKISGNMYLAITDAHTLSCDGSWYLYKICFIPLELPA